MITEEDVAAIVTPSPTHTIFNLTDAVVEGRTAAALAAYRDCLYLGSKSPAGAAPVGGHCAAAAGGAGHACRRHEPERHPRRDQAPRILRQKTHRPGATTFQRCPCASLLLPRSTATSKAAAQRGWIWTLSSKKSSSTAAPPSLCAADARRDKRSFAHSQRCGRLLYRKECFLL